MAVLRRADAEEFSEFAAARSGSLFRTAYLVIGDYQLAQDLVQESLTKTYLAWPRLRDVSNAEAYTRRVIITTCVSWRRRRSFGERPSESLPDLGLPDPTTLLPEQDELWAAVHRLPPRQRAAVVLRFCGTCQRLRQQS
jgi:DNA-directed RNA polymerase specialized sigma24 family protein